MTTRPWRMRYNGYILSYTSWDAAVRSALHFGRYNHLSVNPKPRVWKQR